MNFTAPRRVFHRRTSPDSRASWRSSTLTESRRTATAPPRYKTEIRLLLEARRMVEAPNLGEALAMSPVTGGVLAPESGVMHYLDSPALTATTPGATFSDFTVIGAVGGLNSSAPFIVFGQDSSNNTPKRYTVTEGLVAATKRDLTNEASLHTAVLPIAVGSDRVVAISLAGHVWYHVGAGNGTWLAANSGTPITRIRRGSRTTRSAASSGWSTMTAPCS